MFTSFSASDICPSTVNAGSKAPTRWRRDSDAEASISSIDLLRSKLLISSVRCSLRLFRESSSKVVRTPVETPRRPMGDGITPVRAEDLYAFQTIDILREQVISTPRVWLLLIESFLLYKQNLFFLFLCVSLLFHHLMIDIRDHNKFCEKINKIVKSSIDDEIACCRKRSNLLIKNEIIRLIQLK